MSSKTPPTASTSPGPPATATTKGPSQQGQPPAPPPPALTPSKVGLRKPGATLQGIRLIADQIVTLVDGAVVRVKTGDWVVYQGAQPVAAIPDPDFPHPYEVVADGILLLDVRQREAIEAITGIGSTRTPADLLAAVERLARIRIGEVAIPFTPGQLEEIAYRAEKRGISVQRAIQDVIARIQDELFHHPS